VTQPADTGGLFVWLRYTHTAKNQGNHHHDAQRFFARAMDGGPHQHRFYQSELNEWEPSSQGREGLRAMGRVTDHYVEPERRHQVRYSLVIRFHEDDLERLKELATSVWPDDHEIVIPAEQDDPEDSGLVRAIWSFNTVQGEYGVVPKWLLREAGFEIVRERRRIRPGEFFVASSRKATQVEDWRPLPSPEESV
jgi:hypothetical protein